MDYGEFRAVRSFDSLQQWRTISVLLVLAYHMQDPLWGALRGYIGVAIFFVISGFLITTLLLREEADRGVASLRGFYIRRAFRILPLYYLALLLFAVPILVAGLGGQVADFKRALPFYLTYQNDLTGSAPFGHSWSLAIEEKFYLLWPAAILLLPLVRRQRLTACLVLLAASCAAPLLGSTYPARYGPILAGCAVALVLHDERGYRLTRSLRTLPVTVLALLLSVVGLVEDDKLAGHSLFALPFAVALAGMVTHRYRLAEVA
ncbi:MAG: acyltransferase family protein, partial [Nocardioidaceae bacterium]